MFAFSFDVSLVNHWLAFREAWLGVGAGKRTTGNKSTIAAMAMHPKINPKNFAAQYPGAKDCVIACIATVIGKSYREVTTAFGLSFDERFGADLSRYPDGIPLLQCMFPLHKLGSAAVPLVSVEGAAKEDIQPTAPASDELKAFLQGKPAVVGYTDPDPKVGPHALAWDGQMALDCSDGRVTSLDPIVIETILLLIPL